MTNEVYVYSYIPRLSEILSKELPDVTVHNVELIVDTPNMMQKVPTEAEINALANASILLTDAHLIHQFYHRLQNVKWVQLTYAGVDRLIQSARTKGLPKFPMTRCSSFQHQMVEYVVAWIINHQRNYLAISELQNTKAWNSFRNIFPKHIPTLRDLNVGILGVGQIGQQIAKALKFFKCSVYGYGRKTTPPKDVELDGYWHGAGIKNILEQCDYIIGVLPATADTKYLLGGDTLKATKKSPVLVNIGRGELISDKDILNALDKKWISGAILDVFEVEPLPKDNPLWTHPKVIVTPHIAAKPTAEDIVGLFKDNYLRFKNNQPLLCGVDWNAGY